MASRGPDQEGESVEAVHCTLRTVDSRHNPNVVDGMSTLNLGYGNRVSPGKTPRKIQFFSQRVVLFETIHSVLSSPEISISCCDKHSKNDNLNNF
ncbi:hypothetical protein NPIL_607101 [Nephila pilipes]|uniref:Uncharacterized protein n=1 Tax=Nephila pilipes TaxID=299642 RepID=A0A8X6TUZ0_NEPPI|nr:hypothetical protein NPIL_607101 [Nephila pilipes]